MVESEGSNPSPPSNLNIINMKNLEKFNAETTPSGTELITRDGREVSEWYYFKTAENIYPVTVVVNGEIYMLMKDGQYDKGYDNGIEEHSLDLFIKPKVKECWVNVYMDENGLFYFGRIGDTKEECLIKKASDSNYIKTIRITDEPE